jgi:hypothetical protein
VVKPDKKVTVTTVNIAVTQGNIAQIDSGLSMRQIVVTDGQEKLHEDSSVEPQMQGAGNGGQNTANPGNSGSGNSGPGNPSPAGSRPRNRKGADSGAANSGTPSQ